MPSTKVKSHNVTVSSPPLLNTPPNDQPTQSSPLDSHEGPSTSPNDVSGYFELSKTADNEKVFYLIRNVFIPNNTFKFKRVNSRSFRSAWLEQYKWLCYSPKVDGAFCLYCSLFAHRSSRSSRLNFFKRLVSEPFKHWAGAASYFKSHESVKNGFHKECEELFLNFNKTVSGKTLPIDEVMVNLGSERARKNRENLKPVIDTIKTCGRLGLPLRGHADSSSFHPEVGGASGRVGNFIELLNYRVRGGDKTLEAHMKYAPKNATYKSPVIQNELINVCGDVILIDITDEVKKNNLFSILGDEVRDIVGKEQMAVVLRYVNSSNEIREDFVKFIHCKEGQSGESLAKLLLDCVSELGLDIDNCRGQGYDGAGNVAGCKNGLAARILSKNPKALYVHCYNHRLNLSVCHGCTISCVRNMMDEVGNLSYFFNLSEPRSKLLKEAIKADTNLETNNRNKLLDVCRTRSLKEFMGLKLLKCYFLQ